MPTKTLSTSVITADHKKGQKAVELFRAAYNKAGLTEDDAQYLNENPEFPEGLTDLIKRCSVSKQFADEEVSSSYGYLSGYKKPRDIAWQSNRLRELFPGIGFHDEKAAQMPVPEGAEGLFVIPAWRSFAELHGVSTYAEAVKIVLTKLKETRNGNFCNYRENEMNSSHLRETVWKAKAMQQIVEQQKGYDLLVIPAQFGIAHRGKSVRRARVVIGGKGFGLGAFEMGIMLLAHPERLANYDDLWIDCAGDDFKPSDGSEFSRAPVFSFRGGRLGFDAYGVGRAVGYYGSASAFFPQ